MTRRQMVIAGHHVIMLYGHWAVNDPRGSGSHEFYDEKLEPLGGHSSGTQGRA